jgi:hypothetical protein
MGYGRKMDEVAKIFEPAKAEVSMHFQFARIIPILEERERNGPRRNGVQRRGLSLKWQQQIPKNLQPRCKTPTKAPKPLVAF